MAELPRLVLPGGGQPQQLGEALHDPGRARAVEGQLHQLGLELLGAIVEGGALVQDEPGRGLLHVGEVGLLGQPEQGEHQTIGELDGRIRHLSDDRGCHPTLPGEAVEDPGEVETLIEQLDRAHRDEGDLARP